ncbi:MAG: hypothetical protein ACLR0F_03615 [Eisenbergiella sp.]
MLRITLSSIKLTSFKRATPICEKDIYYTSPAHAEHQHKNYPKTETDSSIQAWSLKTLAYILREWKVPYERKARGDEYQDFDLVVALPNGRPCEDRIILKELPAREDGTAKGGLSFSPSFSTTYKLKLNHGFGHPGDTGHARLT